MKTLFILLATITMANSQLSFADHHEKGGKECTCSTECAEKCSKGEGHDCKCEHCDCAKGGKCDAKTCKQHKGKHGKDAAKDAAKPKTK